MHFCDRQWKEAGIGDGGSSDGNGDGGGSGQRPKSKKNAEKKKGRVQLININHIPELLKEGEEDEDDENSLAGKEAEGWWNIIAIW